MFDEDSAMMRRERGHDVLPFQFTKDEVFGSIELDSSLGIDFPNPRHVTFSDGQGQMPVRVDVLIEMKILGQMAQMRPEPIPKGSWISGLMLGQTESAARLLEVIVAKESIAASANRAKIGAAMTKNPNLPDVVEALHGRVSARLFRRDESKMDSEKKMEPEDLGETVTVSPSARGSHLVVHLGDQGKPHNLPGIKKMEDKGDRLLISELMGRNGLAGDVDSMEGIEPGKPLRPPQMTRSDQVGLLEIAHRPSPDVRIGRPIGRFSDFDLSRLPGPGQYLFDGRDDRQGSQTSFKELVMDRLGSDPGEGRSTGLMSNQFLADLEDFADNRIARPMRDVKGSPTSIEKAIFSEFPVATQPFGEPGIAPLDSPLDAFETNSIFMKPNRFDSEGVFITDIHPLQLLPKGMGRSLCEKENAFRCPYGFSHLDVLMEIP